MQRILIIHYHMNPGGVTRIIESQIKAITEHGQSGEVVLITSSCGNYELFEKMGAKIITQEKLDYSQENIDPLKELETLRAFFTSIIEEEDILHIHNPNLGKNPVLTFLFYQLAMSGYPIVYHIHDFIEDRPANYQFMRSTLGPHTSIPIDSILYPYGENVEFAVLSSFDANRLRNKGIKEDKIHLLANPVDIPFTVGSDSTGDLRSKIAGKLHFDKLKKIVTYPVRVIQRKNIGEFILLCHLFRDQANWLVTQPPKNPAEIEIYLKWKSFCADNKIPVIFEAGVDIAFEDIMAVTDFCITTSIREGFGMVFTEPWLFNIPVVGRYLPNIIPDLEKTGMEFPLLYHAIRINTHNSDKDFAELNFSDQMVFIGNLIKDVHVAEALIKSNRFLENLLISTDENLIRKNKLIVQKEFSLKTYAERLDSIYQKFAG